VERTVAACAGARLRRETAIAAHAARKGASTFQAGLFDRREQHAHGALEDARRADAEQLAERTATVQRAAALAATAPELLLVIAGARRA
jgi:hypothetical protein